MSFIYAFEGIFASIRQERHLRFHLVITNLIMVFAYFYGISKMEWAILMLDISAVVSAELVNTAVERAVDSATTDIIPQAKVAKDAGAGAVLVLAFASIFVGFCLFGNLENITKTLIHIFTTPKILIPCLILGVFDTLFLILGGKNVKKI